MIRDELIKEKEEFCKKDLEERQRIQNSLKCLAKNILDFGLEGIKCEIAKRGVMEFTESFNKMNVVIPDELQRLGNENSLIKAAPYVSELAISEGVDFVYNRYVEKIGALNIQYQCFEFKVFESYPDDYMIQMVRKEEGDIYNFLKRELEYYKAGLLYNMKPNLDTDTDFEWMCDPRLLSYLFAYSNAYYRLGFEGVYPTYDLYEETLDPVIYQKIKNCTEISHILNKEKRKEKKL